MRLPILLLLALLTMGTIGRAAADPFFSLPAACVMGEDCFIQNYVDTDASPAAADFSCGRLTYDGHKGTDIRLKNYVAMERGVDVLASAPGTVLRLRDGMDDVSVQEIGVEAIKDRMAGNSVIIDHGDGWITQYGHMKKGSIIVTPGQRVAAGDKLGQIGLSGNTEFPHLHFELRHNDQPVDPFTGETIGAGCNVSKGTLWQGAPVYQPTGLLAAGFAIGKPEPDASRHGAYASVAPTAGSAALVFWVDLFGLQGGDQIIQQMILPDGSILAESNDTAAKPKAQYFSFVGKKKPADGWKPGTYRGSIRLLRDGEAVIDHTAEIQVR